MPLLHPEISPAKSDSTVGTGEVKVKNEPQEESREKYNLGSHRSQSSKNPSIYSPKKDSRSSEDIKYKSRTNSNRPHSSDRHRRHSGGKHRRKSHSGENKEKRKERSERKRDGHNNLKNSAGNPKSVQRDETEMKEEPKSYSHFDEAEEFPERENKGYEAISSESQEKSSNDTESCGNTNGASELCNEEDLSEKSKGVTKLEIITEGNERDAIRLDERSSDAVSVDGGEAVIGAVSEMQSHKEAKVLVLKEERKATNENSGQISDSVEKNTKEKSEKERLKDEDKDRIQEKYKERSNGDIHKKDRDGHRSRSSDHRRHGHDSSRKRDRDKERRARREREKEREKGKLLGSSSNASEVGNSTSDKEKLQSPLKAGLDVKKRFFDIPRNNQKEAPKGEVGPNEIILTKNDGKVIRKILPTAKSADILSGIMSRMGSLKKSE